MRYVNSKVERRIFWVGEIADYYEDKEEESFHHRHIYSVMDESKKIFRNIRVSCKSAIRKKSLPKIGDYVVLSYYKHSDSFDDDKRTSIIEETMMTMNELEKYSDEEIKKEYWRRRTMSLSKYKSEWHYWDARIIEMVRLNVNYNKSCYKYAFKVEPMFPQRGIKGNELFKVQATLNWKFKDYPKRGDIVKLRYKKHVHGIDYIDESRIIEIVKER